MAAKDDLLGNGTLTVASRLTAVIGVPLAALLLGFLGNEIWGELKENRRERAAVAVTLGEFRQRFADMDRRNDQQDRYIDQLRDRAPR